ncbi:hypothetical protein J6590_087150 [Homalodisca vitripennis]|nr:hypothetical protein J6590_087150 [Homalodisca vitripennis]
MSLALWLCITIALVPFSSATKGTPSYVIGQYTRSTKYAFLGHLEHNFDTGAVVLHFNTCYEYRFKIDKIVVTTPYQYPSVQCHLVAGGIYDTYFGLKVTGRGLTFYDLEVWVTWRATIVTVEQAFVLKEFKMFHPCANPRPSPPLDIDN